MGRPVHTAIGVTSAVNSPRRRRHIIAIIGAVTVVCVIEAQDPLDATDDAADHASYHGSDRPGSAIADRHSVCRASGYALGLRGDRHSECADEHAGHQDILVH
jgi:hypothetical protein